MGHDGRHPPSSSTYLSKHFNTQPHVLCWNAAVLACSEARDPDGCLALLAQMQERGQAPGAINYARTVGALGRAGRIEEARALLAGARGDVDRAAYGALILACGARGDGAAAGAVVAVVAEMGAVGLAPDALTVAQAVSALARGCGRLGEAETLLLGSPSGEGEGGGASLLAYHALMLAAVEREGEGGGQAARRCEALLAAMVERHGLCPTQVTRALLCRAGCGPAALAAVVDAVVPASEGEGEGDGDGVMVSFEAAKRSVERALALNPHDERRRTLHRFLGTV